MKKLIIALSFIGLSAISFAGDTTTNRIGLINPALESFGWGPKYWANNQIIDGNAAWLGLPNIFTSTNTFTSTTTFSGPVIASSITASFFIGDGSGLTGLPSSISYPILAPHGPETNPSYSFDGVPPFGGGGLSFVQYSQFGILGPAIFSSPHSGCGPLATAVFESGQAWFSGPIVASTGSFNDPGLNEVGGGILFSSAGLELHSDGSSKALVIDDWTTLNTSAIFDPNGIADIKTNVKMSNYGAGAATFDASGNIVSEPLSDAAPRTNITPRRAGQSIYNSTDREICTSSGTTPSTWFFGTGATPCGH